MIKNAYKVIPSILASLLITMPTFAASTVDKTEETDFTINLLEVLTVQVSSEKVSDTEQTNSVGDVFLKDFTQLHVQTNNASGFSATMTTKTTNTALKNTTDGNITIPTLTSNVTEASFPVNKWGFSLNGSNASTAVYRPLVGSDSTTPSVIAKTTTGADSYTNIYFGTKGNATTTSGTYANTVVISVTAPPSASDNPVPPIDNPVEPVTPVNNNPAPSRAPARTVTDTEEPSASEGHEDPQGVVEDTTTEEVHLTGSNLGMSLATGATVTAAAGLIFFVLAKRKEDEDEETK